MESRLELFIEIIVVTETCVKPRGDSFLKSLRNKEEIGYLNEFICTRLFKNGSKGGRFQ